MEKIKETNRVRNEEVLHAHGVKEERNILRVIKDGRLTELVIYCVETAICNTLMKEGWTEGANKLTLHSLHLGCTNF